MINQKVKSICLNQITKYKDSNKLVKGKVYFDKTETDVFLSDVLIGTGIKG